MSTTRSLEGGSRGPRRQEIASPCPSNGSQVFYRKIMRNEVST